MANHTKILRGKSNEVGRARPHDRARGNDDEVEVSWQVHTFLDEHVRRHFKARRKRLPESVRWAFSIAEHALTQAVELFRIERKVANMLRALARRFGAILGHDTVKRLVSSAEKRLGFALPDKPLVDRNEKFRERVKRG